MLRVLREGDGKAVRHALHGDLHVRAAAANAGQLHGLGHLHAAVTHGANAQRLDLAGGLLVQVAVLHGNLARQRHLTEPLFARQVLLDIPVLHPRDHQAPAVRREHSLHGVEVRAVVDDLMALLGEGIRRLVVAADEGDVAVARVAARLVAHHVLRADQEHALAVQGKEVRAFPHAAQAAAVFRQLLYVAPVDRVLAFKQQDLAAAVRRAAGDHGAVHAVAAQPELRVAEVDLACALGQHGVVEHRVAVELLVVNAVADRQTLGLAIDLGAILALFKAHAGVHQQMAAVGELNRVAGETARAVVIGLIRRERTGQGFPVKQVAAHSVRPVHRPPLRPVRVILVKKMILALVAAQAVRVVHPAHTGGEVVRRALVRGDILFLVRLIGSRFEQLFTDHNFLNFFRLYRIQP